MDIQCPYCNTDLEICHDDGFGYDENIKHHMVCDVCGKIFVFETYISFDYETKKADCLNDSNHNYKITKTYPKEFSKMKCEYCDIERELTEEEHKEFIIGTKGSYLKKIR